MCWSDELFRVDWHTLGKQLNILSRMRSGMKAVGVCCNRFYSADAVIVTICDALTESEASV